MEKSESVAENWGGGSQETGQRQPLSRAGEWISNSMQKLHLPDDVTSTRRFSQSRSSSSDSTEGGKLEVGVLLFLRTLRGEGVWGTDTRPCPVFRVFLLVSALRTSFRRETSPKVGTCIPSNTFLFFSGTEFMRKTSTGVTSRVAGSDSKLRMERRVPREVRLRFWGASSEETN